VMIEGPAGTGKSFILNNIDHLVRSLGKNIINVAGMGVAATLLRNGRTVHSCFGLPLFLDSKSNSNVKSNSRMATELHKADVIVWDEAILL
jgi:PIF1-like helicase